MYFPYHPVRWRLTLAGTALGAAVLTAWGALGWYNGGGWVEAVRTTLMLGLLSAITSIAFRLRPRAGWGVHLGPTSLTVARPTVGHLDIPWSTVREIRRLGRARGTLALFLTDDRRVLVAHQLFARRRDFEALVAAIEEKMPPLPYDA